MIKLFLMRHAKSCSNHVRSVMMDHAISQSIRDPGLSVHGADAARAYGPRLRSRLASVGIDLRSPQTFIGTSGLRRAQETAMLVVGSRSPVTVLHFKENGNIPENIPAGDSAYEPPHWRAFQRALHAAMLKSNATAALVVGHGSFLASQFPEMNTFNNLDGVFLLGRWSESESESGPVFQIIHSQPFRAPTLRVRAISDSDRCSVVQRNISSSSRNMKRTHAKKQRGGGYGMSQAWFTQGAQLTGTSATPTGQGLAATTSEMVRMPLTQSGGASRSRRRRRRHSTRKHVGGFHPSIMGSFVTTGAGLMPAASYMGYKLFKTKTKRTRKNKRQSKE